MAKAPSVVLDYVSVLANIYCNDSNCLKLISSSECSQVLGERLGLGGNGAVYQGIHTISGGFAAIKQIKISNLPKDKVASIMVSELLILSTHNVMSLTKGGMTIKNRLKLTY